ncbi:hypothetical protein BDQ17DRAFT_1425737 [Cyathus striatus]|nr:hypothetical protein BDQ17DRAFT_1425737 [Cyathus striatus]
MYIIPFEYARHINDALTNHNYGSYNTTCSTDVLNTNSELTVAETARSEEVGDDPMDVDEGAGGTTAPQSDEVSVEDAPPSYSEKTPVTQK